jgi:hypothetical protein
LFAVENFDLCCDRHSYRLGPGVALSLVHTWEQDGKLVATASVEAPLLRQSAANFERNLLQYTVAFAVTHSGVEWHEAIEIEDD